MSFKHFIGALLLPLAFAACQSGPRTVENPLIETSNTRTLDIVKVELTDTATILQVDAYFTPRYWIRIDSKTYLQADGQKYALTSAQGITPDSLFWMPDSGEASFQLTFQPLPLGTKKSDFSEADCEDCSKLYGIDLTGKATYDTPEGIPAEALVMDGNASVPEPIFKSGETTVDVHLLHYRPELVKELNLYVNTLWGSQEENTASIDPETGTATFSFKQYGPAQGLMAIGRLGGSTLWLAPGEHVELYYDMRATGHWMVARRENGVLPPFRPLYATGTYANLNSLWNSGENKPLHSMNLYNGEFADYRMSAEDYVAHVIDTYKALSDSIATDTLLPLDKEILQLGLKEETVNAMMQGDYFREHNYRSSHNDWDFKTPVKGIAKLKPEQQAAVAQLFDINDPMLLMGWQASDYIGAVVYADNAWLKATGINDGLIPSLRKFAPLARKAQAAELTDTVLQAFTPEESFYTEALKSMQQAALDKLKAAEGKAVIEQTPDVPVAKLFDAIVAPYKGKVVFVDFWNTWCGPCRASIKATEPLKSTELKHDDLVWIYIANESSPIVQYKTMIPGIQGKHYRLNDKQWAYLGDKFKIDGIPSYVVVDKDGTYKLRNDLRDHSLLVPTLQEKLAE